jgi:protein-disulfide isomerase
MHRIVDEYGKDGKVAWVYRHFPLDAIHPKTRKEAEATECAAELGGNAKFWEYIDRLFEITPSNNGLDPDLLPQIATYVGLDEKEFENCLDSGRYAGKIEEQYQDAIRSGGRGTPHSFVITSNNTLPLQGAQPYTSVKSIIDSILEQTAK